MRVTAAMVQFMLEQAGYVTSLWGNPENEVSHVRILRPGKRKAGVLYLEGANDPHSTESPKKARTAKRSRASWKTGACLTADPDCKADSIELLEAASDSVTALQAWDARLKEALTADMPLDEFVQLAEDVFPYAYGFYDSNVSPLGASSNYAEWVRAFSGDDAIVDAQPNGTFPAAQLADLFEDEEYQNAPLHREPFYYSSSFPGGLTNYSYCLNVFDADIYVARFVVLGFPDEGKLPRGAEQIVEHFVAALATRYVRFTGSNTTFGNQHDSIHELFDRVLFTSEQVGNAQIESTLAAYGWERAHRFCVVKLVFFEAVRWDTAALFICQQLERRVRSSCAMPQGRSIAWVVNETLLGDENVGLVTETLVDTIRTYACKAGISNDLDDFALLQIGYRQCEAALTSGAERNPHWWYYRFGDYVLDYLLRKATEDMSGVLLVSEKLQALRLADKDEGSEYIATLRCYLNREQNATHTAKDLFMHRTSLLRRLERIEKIAGIDFSDPDEILYLQISLRLLGQET